MEAVRPAVYVPQALPGIPRVVVVAHSSLVERLKSLKPLAKAASLLNKLPTEN